MALDVAPSVPPPRAGSTSARTIDPDAYIDRRLDETRRHVWGVDLSVAVLKLLIGVLGYLLAVAVVDHWVVAEGLGSGSRLALWAVLVLWAGWYAVRAVVPLLVHRINPLFAAQTIEQARPSLKNGLINLLLLRRERPASEHDELAERVYLGLQFRTAQELVRVPPGTAVDRLQVVRLGYVLASLVAILCLYLVVSPKNPLVSFGRVILPWARIGAPTRVTIDRIQPGHTTAYQGDTVLVSAEVRGLRSDEPVLLYYSTEDGQVMDQAVPMSVPEGGYRHQAELPPGSLGLQQSLLYYVLAGDAASAPFRIDMQIPPTITVDRLEYEYPEYTGLPRREVVGEGDIRALEGTRVTIHARANYPIEQAFVDLEGPTPSSLRMAASGTAAQGQLTLALTEGEPAQPKYSWYQLRFVDPDRRPSRRPTRYRIEVIPDLRPEIRLIDPPPEGFALPESASVELKVRAEDPDFGLRQVVLRAEREGRGLMIPPLMRRLAPEKPHQGPFEGSYRFEPARLQLKAGDRVVYWAEAADCRQTEQHKGAAANVATTEKRTIRIVASQTKSEGGRQPGSRAGDSRGGAQPTQQGSEQTDRPSSDQPAEGPGEPEPKPSAESQPAPNLPSAKPSPAKHPPGDSAQRSPDQPGQPRDRSGGSQAQQEPGKSPERSQGPSDQTPQASSDQTPQGPPDQTRQGPPDQTQKPRADQGADQQAGSKPQAGSEPNEASREAGSAGGQKGSPDQAGTADQPPDAAKAPVDGQTDPGEAIRRILDHRQEQLAQAPPADQGQAASQSNQPQSGATAPGPKPSFDQQTAKPQPEQPKGESGQPKVQPGPSKAGAEPSQPAGGSPSEPSEQRQGEQARGGADRSGDADRTLGAKQAPGAEPSGTDARGRSPQPRQPDSAASRHDLAEKTSQPADSTELGETGQPKAKPGESVGAKPTAPERVSEEMSEGPLGPQPPASAPTAPKPVAPKTSEASEGGERSPADRSKRGSPQSPDTGSSPSQQKAEPGSSEARKGPQAVPKEPSAKSPSPAQPGEPKTTAASPPPDEQTPSSKQAEAARPNSEGSEEAQSPSISPKPSTAKSDTPGDRSGAGGQGGGQQSPQAGKGTPGSQSPAPDGGAPSEQTGEGETGWKPGDQTQADRATGKPSAETPGQGSSARNSSDATQPQKQSAKPDATEKAGLSTPQTPRAEPLGDQEPGQPGGTSSPVPLGGGQPGANAPGNAGHQPPPSGPDDPNLQYARMQTELALEHLEDQLAKQRPELLQRLGWDRAYAENFLRQWQQMKKAAMQSGPEGEAAKRELDQALKSLGLRPARPKLRGPQEASDAIQQLQSPGRFPPPADWIQHYRAYTQGVAGSKP